jgi:hypothetical protein
MASYEPIGGQSIIKCRILPEQSIQVKRLLNTKGDWQLELTIDDKKSGKIMKINDLFLKRLTRNLKTVLYAASERDSVPVW